MSESGQDLASLVDQAPLVVCLGPGGVGKTTLSAVLALRQAAAGKRSLVLTIDPARRLADALGLGGLTNDAVEVTSFAKMHPQGSLSALMLDPTATFDHLVAMLVSDPARREALFANRYYQHMSRSLAGTLEYMAVERLHDLTRSKKFDAIVLDTPPTTNALDFLEAPEKIAVFFSERVVKWLMPAEKRSESWTKRLFSRAGSVALGLMSRVAGEEFVSDTAGFFGAFSDLLGSFRARGLEVGKLLRDPKTAFLVVCAPDLTRLDEAVEIDRRLAGAGCKVHGFVVNRVDEAFLPLEGELERTIERATLLMGGEAERERVRSFMQRLEKLRQDHESNAQLHAQVVEKLRAHAAPRPVFSAPRIPAGQSPRASLLALYVGLFAGAEAPEPPEVTAA